MTSDKWVRFYFGETAVVVFVVVLLAWPLKIALKPLGEHDQGRQRPEAGMKITYSQDGMIEIPDTLEVHELLLPPPGQVTVFMDKNQQFIELSNDSTIRVLSGDEAAVAIWMYLGKTAKR